MMFLPIKKLVESIFGCRIYRNSVPRGTDIRLDIAKAYGIDTVRIAFDVGANTGQSAVAYLDYFPRAAIYSFEPVGATYAELKKTTEKFPRIQTFRCGMAREPGQTRIDVPEHHSPASSIVNTNPANPSEIIDLDSLTHFCREHRIERIDFLKIDTEGYEIEVLQGAVPLLKEQKIRMIFVECEPVARSNYFVPFPTLAEFLAVYGYELFGIYEQQAPYFGEKQSLIYFNALFICPELVTPAKR